MNEFNIHIGKRIRKLRENCGYTREKLAELAEMNDKFLYEVETGRKGLSAYKMFMLSRTLGVTMDFLVSEEQKDEDCKRIALLLNGLNKSEVKMIEDIIRRIIILSKHHPQNIQKYNSLK